MSEEICAKLLTVPKDLIADTRSINISSTNGVSMLSVSTGEDILSYRITDIAHRQIADRLNIPYKYYERMRLDYPALLDKNVNGWLLKNPERRMLRTLDGKLRAFLSDRYRRLDNLELVDHVLPVIAVRLSAVILPKPTCILKSSTRP